MLFVSGGSKSIRLSERRFIISFSLLLLPASIGEVGDEGLSDPVDDADVPLRDDPSPNGRAEEEVSVGRLPARRRRRQVLVGQLCVFAPQVEASGGDEVQPRRAAEGKGRKTWHRGVGCVLLSWWQRPRVWTGFGPSFEKPSAPAFSVHAEIPARC